MEGELHSLEDTNILSWSGSSRPPPISPDELVIRSRGKRRVPAKFSPERKEAAAVPKSPAKPVTVYLNPGQMMMRKFSSEFYRSQLIGAPRKNLFPSVQNVQKKDETRDDSNIDTSEVTPAKKLKTTELKLNVNNNEDNLDDSLKLIKVLSRDQMTNILTELAKHDVTTQQKLTEMLPSEPDISPQLKNLAYHGINVYKALPRSRLTNHHDSFSYSKVSVHLAVFRKVLQEDLIKLEESEHWPTIIRYVIGAWEIVMKSPVWEDSVHNKCRISCFRNLAAAAMKTYKNYELDVNTRKKLLDMMASSSMGEFQSHCDVLSSSLGQLTLKI